MLPVFASDIPRETSQDKSILFFFKKNAGFLANENMKSSRRADFAISLDIKVYKIYSSSCSTMSRLVTHMTCSCG